MMGGVTETITCGGREMTALVLAGGRGRRMGADKAGLDIGGRTLLEHVLVQIEPLFDEILVSISDGRPPGTAGRARRRTDIRLVVDDVPGQGPVGGILAGLKAARNDACLAVACDIPDIDLDLLRLLARTACWSEIAVPVGPAGLYEPLFAVYRKSVIPRIEGLLASGERSLLPLFDRCRTAVVQFEDAGRIRNLNTRADYEAYRSLATGRAGGPPACAAGRSGRRRARAGKD